MQTDSPEGGLALHAGTAAARDDDVLYRNDRTLIVRRWLADGRSVIDKHAFGPDAQDRLQHEAAILRHLAGVPGVIQLAGHADTAGVLRLEDGDGQSLAELARQGTLNLQTVLSITIDLLKVLNVVHRAGIVHKDINPGNILLCGPERKPMLIDFNIASRFAEERPGFIHHNHIAGTLAYMAPEQTGRTGRTVDQRSDLYALGVTLYELTTGRKPFDSEDLLELVHDHLVNAATPPVEVQPSLPHMLSAIIMKLLSKEADKRYQSAEGLQHDLMRVREALARGEHADFALGETDFPLRLTPPSRLIGRDEEVSALDMAIERAIQGEHRAMLVAGSPGVGKSALINELQPLVTERQGWFVSGKFDQYHQEATSATTHALRALGRLILAEPEHALDAHRENILQAMGANLGFGPCRLPEFALLLGDMPEHTVGDPQEAEARLLQSCIDLLRAVASPSRPLVVFLDDLQWAPLLSLRFVDTLLTSEQPVPGLLLVGAYRQNEVDAAHPLGGMLTRWSQLGVAPPVMTLANLPPGDTSALIGEMLRLPCERAQLLGHLISPRTDGNPYDTVELINALRHDGELRLTDGSWQWDAPRIQHYVGDCDVVGLLNKRIQALPETSIRLLETLAWLGGDAHWSLLNLASGLPFDVLQARLAPALEDGLLVTDDSEDRTIRFRHDRVQQAMFERMSGQPQGAERLALARRLSTDPRHASLAARQYLDALDEVTDPQERRAVALCFHKSALLYRVANYVLTERLVSAALQLLSSVETPDDGSTILALLTERHAALYGLARLDEADAVYAQLAQRQPDAIDMVEAACVQIASLSKRERHKDAVALGLDLLAQLGLETPPDLRMAIGMGLFRMGGWIAGEDKLADIHRPELSAPRLVALSKLLSKTQVAAFFCSAKIGSWLTMESQRLWVEEGPHPALMATLCSTPMQLIAIAQDYKGAHTVARHLVAVGEARGYQPATSVARFLYAFSALHWFEPIERSLAHYRQAREGLIQGGDLQYAVFTYNSWPVLLDSAPTLSACAEDVEGGMALSARAGDQHMLVSHRPSRQLIKVLRGDMPAESAPGCFNDETFDEKAHEQLVAEPTLSTVYYCTERALSAALFNDTSTLIEHAGRAMALIARTPGNYINTWIYLLQALALAERLRPLPEEERAPWLTQFDLCRTWMSQRAVDAPGNFRHLLQWLEAERAWAIGDAWGAVTAFDAAISLAQHRSRPWQEALVTERAARLHLTRGLEHSGKALMNQACAIYRAWGAGGKVRHLLNEQPHLRQTGTTARRETAGRSTMVSSDAVDVMSVLRASQALSSETSLERLTARVGKVLSAMTGATSVVLAARGDDGQGWLVSRATGDDQTAHDLDEAVASGLLPLSAFRYAERTREPLLLSEATRDERFARDPYFMEVEHSAMLLVPVLSHGQVRAILVLENRLTRGAFSMERLDPVTMIAGQLAVSLDNALLYTSLERKVAERTMALQEANRRLEQISITDALTGLANRRRFNEALDAEWLRARRHQSPVGLAMIDVDQFKLYNDHYGHQAGDECLKLVATAMKAGLRLGSDLIARYGGEEFVLLLPEADLAGTWVVAERVRQAVAAHQAPHATSIHGIVTVSIGIVSLVPTHDTTASQLIEVADAALYEAKRNGRNQVRGVKA